MNLPRLDAAKTICIDCETYDPELLTKGPGWGRGVGCIVGLAVGTDDGQRWYLPMRHTAEPEDNLPPETVLRWARDELGRANQPKCGANLQYDIGWLLHEGVRVRGDLIDVQLAEPLLNEHSKSFSLDTLGQKYLGEGKATPELYRWIADNITSKQGALFGGGKASADPRAEIWRAPPRLVGPYAMGDVDLPLRIWERQRIELAAQALMQIWEVERALPYPLAEMRLRGIRVDLDRAAQVREIFQSRADGFLDEIKRLSGINVNINAARSLAQAFDKLGIWYPRTAKDEPSFTADWLEHHKHPITAAIRGARKFQKAAETFIDEYIFDKVVNDRIHGSFHQMRSDAGGTIVGRLSSSTPNLGNIPARDPEIGPPVRSIFLPEDGEAWHVLDYSQIQFRIMTHYAIGRGAEEARARYRLNPETDYHSMTQLLIREMTGIELDRKPVKNINFGLAFTMGIDKLSRMLGLTVEEAKQLIAAYHAGLPFVRETANTIANVAQKRGFIRGILGRRHRFPYWEARAFGERGAVNLNKEEAVKKWGNVVRAYTHLGLNRLAQDGEGTTMKKAVGDMWKAGLLDEFKMLNIVHDDINFSAQANADFTQVRELMADAVKWNVPILVSQSVGPNWGEQDE